MYVKLANEHKECLLVRYPLGRGEVHAFPLLQGQVDFDKDSLFQNRIPDRLVVGLVHANSFNGNIAYDPFSVKKFGLEWIKQLINGEEYPYSKTLTLNHNNNQKDPAGYFRFLQGTGLWHKGQACIIRPEQWGQGANCTLFLFDNVSGGDLRLQFKPNAGLGHIATVVVYGEFENVLEIDNNGGVIYGV